MEHLQKIPYLLSIFFPIALFFSIGLGIAYYLWHKHSRRLTIALKENHELNTDLIRVYGSERTTKGITPEELQKIESNWQLKLEAQTQKNSELDLHFANFKSDKEQEVAALLNSNHSLKSGIEAKPNNTTDLESKLAAAQDSISELTTKLKIIELEQEDVPDSSAVPELESKLNSLQDQLESKDQELNQVRSDLESANSTSRELVVLKTEFTNLQAQINTKNSEITSLKHQLDSAQNETTEANSSAVDVKEVAPAPDFSGEEVKEDEKLGIIYTSRPDNIDDLKLIKGVAKVLEAKLHEIGIYKFKQIANWDETHMTEFSDRLAFPGRIQRDDWKTQSIQFHKDKYGTEA